nr:unnamed protein product [Callosobruchus chinensis]
MAPNCSKCDEATNSGHLSITCPICSRTYHASCVNLTANEICFFTEGNDKWTCSQCCKASRVTRSNSTSSAWHEAPVATPATGSDQLSLIMSQIASIARDIKDIKDFFFLGFGIQ